MIDLESRLAELKGRLPSMPVSTADSDKINYARDLYPLTQIRMQHGRVGRRPRAVVWPGGPAEVAEVARWASAAGVALIPYGAGSGVCGGTQVEGEAVIVDLKRMNRVLDLDEKSLLVRVQPGVMGEDLERWLNRRGYTLGHFPSSIYCSSVGGWLAARSAG